MTKRSPVWIEWHLLPTSIKLQIEDGKTVAQIPGMSTITQTCVADTKEEAFAALGIVDQDEVERLRADLAEAKRLNADWLKENGPGGWIDKLRAEVEALREALRLAMVNAYSPEDVIEITEAALAAAGRKE